MPESYYAHGTDATEQQRLTALNQLLNDRCLAAIRLAPGDKVIDFGAGLGQFSRAMARTTGVRVTAVERSSEQIREALAQAARASETGLLDMRAGDVEAPPLQENEWGNFDVAHARFVLEHVRDPELVVRNMVRSVRPGGRIVLADDDYETLRLWPEPAGFTSVWRAYQRTYDRHGNDPCIGRRLVQLLHQANAAPSANTLVFFGSCAGQPDFTDFVTNLATVVAEARDDIAETGIPQGTVDAAIEALHRWQRLPDATLWYGIFWAEGTRILT